jgi:hypothetical protein
VMGAVALATLLGAHSIAAEPTVNSSGAILEPAVWQGPEMNAPSSSASTVVSTRSAANPLRVAYQPAAPLPPQNVHAPTAGAPAPTKAPAPALSPAERAAAAASTPASPLLNGSSTTEQMLPPVMDGGCETGNSSDGPLHIQAYGGGHPNDWSWGCGGSPYRQGPGMCDNYRIGPRWHITVDGIVMSRDRTDLGALTSQMAANDINGTAGAAGFENFSVGPGGRVSFMSQVGRCTGWDLQAVYEGVNDWNASIVFPKTTLDNIPLTIPPNTGTVVTVPPIGIDTEPPAPFPQEFQQRSLHYRSNFNSGEINFFKNNDSDWRFYCGVRFIRVDDDINDSLNQDTQAPMAGPRTETIVPVGGTTPITVNDPIGPTYETDRVNIYRMQNNLSGFQIGLLHDTLCLTDRFSIEGFLNGGIYYNQAKYSNTMGVFTTQTFADNTRSTAVDDSRVDVSNITNNDSREFAEVSYEGEASLTGVCRLNRCWALRAGYQVLWINHLHLADQAFLGNPGTDSDLFFQGWHAGLECRR